MNMYCVQDGDYENGYGQEDDYENGYGQYGGYYKGRLISNAHSEISRKRDHVFTQTKVGSKVQYFSYKFTYLFFDIVALSFNTFFPT
jgi:hypothetical protein